MKTRKQLRPYATPAMDIVWLKTCASLLTGSDTIGGYEEGDNSPW